GSPACAATQMGRKAPAESAERMAKRTPHTALENRLIFSSIGMCDLISPIKTHQGSGDDQDKSISGPLDNITFVSVASQSRTIVAGPRSLTASIRPVLPLRIDFRTDS